MSLQNLELKLLLLNEMCLKPKGNIIANSTEQSINE